jgi:bifunctional non-homologous end joining protein LigD
MPAIIRPETHLYSSPQARRVKIDQRQRLPALPTFPSHRVRPMLATLVSAPFDRDGWYFELKWDGFRALAEVKPGAVKLYSRNQESFKQRFSPIVASLTKLKIPCVLDGEIVALNAQGQSSFQLLQNYQRTGQGHLRYYVFDLLAIHGQDLRGLPLSQRKRQLVKVIKGLRNVLVSAHQETYGQAFFQAAAQCDFEGMIAKDAQSLYQEGKRSKAWLKIKAHKSQEAIICGFTEPRRSREYLGSLVLGVYDQGELVYIGQSGGGFDRTSLREVYQLLQPLQRKQSPFQHPPKTQMPVHWVEPRLICQVRFQEWTSAGRMRHPLFLGLRYDKSAKQVMRERPAGVPKVAGAQRTAGAKQKKSA